MTLRQPNKSMKQEASRRHRSFLTDDQSTPRSPEKELTFINKIKILNPVMLLLYIDAKPMSLQLTKTPWFSGGCHICFHFSPSGCCKNKFQGRHVPGTCLCYLADYSSSQCSFRVPGRVLLSCIIQRLPWLFGSEAPRFARPRWDLGTRTLQGALLCKAVVYACGHPAEARSRPALR